MARKKPEQVLPATPTTPVSSPIFRTDYQGPYHPDRASQTIAATDKYLQSRRQFEDAVRPDVREVTFNLVSDKPVRIFTFSDLHFGHDSTDHQAMDGFVNDVLADPSCLVLFLGDELEGIKGDYLRTNVTKTAMDFDQQIRAFKNKYLRPLVAANKVLAIVDGYEGHNEWANTASTVNSIRDMVEEFNIPIVENGGKVIFQYPNGTQSTMEIYHNPGGGSTRLDPLGALRKKSRSVTLDKSPQAFAHGHNHLTAIGEEAARNPLTGKDTTVSLAVTGTLKGTDRDHQDPFFVTNGRPAPSPYRGVYFIAKDGDQKDQKLRPVIGMDDSRFLRDAFELLNQSERAGTTRELMQEIEAKNKTPKPRTNFAAARRNQNDRGSHYSHGMYEVLPISLETNLPTAIFPISHMRFGSKSLKETGLTGFIQDIINTPNCFGITLGEIVDPNLATRQDRYDHLLHAANILKPLDNANRHLATMFMGGLRHDRWADNIAPSEYLRSHGIRAPFVLHESILPIKVDDITYNSMLLYHLNASGNTQNLFLGLTKAADNTRLDLDLVMGGHLANSGYMQTPAGEIVRTLIAPGWWSTFKGQNKANAREVPLGGQSAVLFPHKRMILASATLSDSWDTFKASYLKYGLDLQDPDFARKLRRTRSPQTRQKLS